MIKMLDMFWPQRNATYKALKDALRRGDYKKFSNLSKEEREDALHIANQVWWAHKAKDSPEKEHAFDLGEVIRQAISNTGPFDERRAQDASAAQAGANTLEALADLLKPSPFKNTVNREAEELSEMAKRMGHENGSEEYVSTTPEIKGQIVHVMDRGNFSGSGGDATPTGS